MSREISPVLLTLTLTLLLSSCVRDPGAPVALRLVDLLPSAVIEKAEGPPPSLPPTVWRFDAGEELAWKSASGVERLEVRDGRLVGTTISDFPIVHVERTSGLDVPDVLHSIEVRARFSKGGNLEAFLVGDETLNVAAAVARREQFGWSFRTPVVPGDAFQTYSIANSDSRIPSIAVASTRHLLLRPLDQAGADFEIESVRLVSRKEHLAAVPAGVSWQGLDDIYRETFVTRSPEVARFELTLPPRPWLDLAVGTVEEGPVTFRVDIDVRGETRRVLQKTVTTAHRWEPAPIDLDSFASRQVMVSISVEADRPGALGFWGAPAIRNRATPDEASPPSGVILIVADTLRRDHLSAYGYERDTAPHLSRLVQEGALFLDAQSQATWTKASVSSILTSLYPATHGVRLTTDRVPASAVTIAERYREAGFATVSFSAVTWTGKGSNLHQGFEELHERTSLRLPAGVSSSKTSRAAVDRLIPWLEAHSDVPFFVLLHVFDPHSPFEPYAPYDRTWATPQAKDEHERETERVLPFIENAFMKLQRLPSRDELVRAGIDPDRFVRRQHDWYDGSIRQLDTELGRLVEALERLGLREHTLLAFTADHGEEFLEHGRPWHGNTVYGEMTNVPLAIWAPGRIPAGIVVSETVQSIDVMPTLLELSGVAPLEGAQGRSLVPLMFEHGERAAPRPAFSERFGQNGTPPNSIAVVSNGFKLVRHLSLPGDAPSDTTWELFDHERDPLNFVNVASEHPEVVERLSRLLEDWYAFVENAKLPPDARASETLNPEELEKLRSLGYVQ